MAKDKYYVTTPIYYVNDYPHIGSALTTLISDVIARYQKSKDRDVYFLTGTDEHGAKIANTAATAGSEPQEFVDKLAEEFQSAWKLLNFEYDFFVRTSDEYHKSYVRSFLQKLYDQGDIYEGVYEGYYCVGCEEFKTEKDLVDGSCPLHKPEQTIFEREKNYFFKLTKYLPDVLKVVENDEYHIIPDGKKSEVVSKLKLGLKNDELTDLSISRTGLEWGIPVPWDKNQTIYVWFDALLNYYSALKHNKNYDRYWPADTHVVGKEIMWFHAVVWPAMLIASGENIPKRLFVHSFFTIDGQKMSKSLGNVISPQSLVDRYGVDGTRFLLITSLPYHNDGDVGFGRYDTKYNAELSNNLGNLVSRLSGLIEKNSVKINSESVDCSYYELVEENFEKFKLHEALEIITQYIARANHYVNEKELWNIKGKDLETELNKLVKDVLRIAYNLRPFMPETAEKITGVFTKREKTGILFPRIEK